MLESVEIKFVALPVLVIFIFFLLGNSSVYASSPEIIVGTSLNYAPFEFKENGTLKGFDVELMEAIAEKQDIKI